MARNLIRCSPVPFSHVYGLGHCLFWSCKFNYGDAETTTKHKEDSDVKQLSEGEKDLTLVTQDSVAPLSSVTTKSSVIGKEDVKTPSKSQGRVHFSPGISI